MPMTCMPACQVIRLNDFPPAGVLFAVEVVSPDSDRRKPTVPFDIDIEIDQI